MHVHVYGRLLANDVSTVWKIYRLYCYMKILQNTVQRTNFVCNVHLARTHTHPLTQSPPWERCQTAWWAGTALCCSGRSWTQPGSHSPWNGWSCSEASQRAAWPGRLGGFGAGRRGAGSSVRGEWYMYNKLRHKANKHWTQVQPLWLHTCTCVCAHTYHIQNLFQGSPSEPPCTTNIHTLFTKSTHYMYLYHFLIGPAETTYSSGQRAVQ